MKALDTSVAVDYLRGRIEAVELIEGLLEADDPVLASELVRFELLAGAHEGELETLERFFAALTWLPVSTPVARTAASLAREHRAAHSGIDDADYLIAATTLIAGARLLTTNVRHFPMVEGLTAAY